MINEINNQLEILDMKNKLFGEIEEQKRIVREINTTISYEKDLDKEDLINNLITLNEKSLEIFDYLQDILFSELPESKKITETSSILKVLLNINKMFYDIKIKHEESNNKATQLNNIYSIDIIEESKRGKK